MAKPAGYGTVTPWIIARGVDGLIKFLEKAFDAVEIKGSRVYSQDGIKGHVEVTIGDSIVMLFDSLQNWPDTPAFFRLYVEDADAVYQKALAAGATSVTQVTELFWGDRVGRVRDPWGNIWWIQAHIKDITPEEMVSPSQELIDQMKYVQETLDQELSGRKRER